MGNPPDLTPHKQAERAAREERLARALRANLRRRKEQARAQSGRADAEADPAALSRGPLSSKSKRQGGTTAD
jgi:hypothetical protein